ncbi:cyclase family protein, partial [Pseudonocardia pini]|uniref:cyclase family protein n=1 Tax=Pseudonocardia pini TaxID=2758030 RepID=UPI0015F0A111
ISLGSLRPVLPRLGPGAVLVVCTGWSAHFGTAAYLDHPWLTADAARAVVAAGVRAVAVDTLSPDPTGTLSVHETVLGAGGVIVENLRGVERLLGQEPSLTFYPLALSGDGSPVRAVAELPAHDHQALGHPPPRWNRPQG